MMSTPLYQKAIRLAETHCGVYEITNVFSTADLSTDWSEPLIFYVLSDKATLSEDESGVEGVRITYNREGNLVYVTPLSYDSLSHFATSVIVGTICNTTPHQSQTN